MRPHQLHRAEDRSQESWLSATHSTQHSPQAPGLLGVTLVPRIESILIPLEPDTAKGRYLGHGSGLFHTPQDSMPDANGPDAPAWVTAHLQRCQVPSILVGFQAPRRARLLAVCSDVILPWMSVLLPCTAWRGSECGKSQAETCSPSRLIRVTLSP